MDLMIPNIPRGRDPTNIRTYELGLLRVMINFLNLLALVQRGKWSNGRIDDSSHDEGFTLM
jgi:hypothetical protein